MKVVGLTGGIGSGKSTVANFLRFLGYPVFEADQVSKSILFKDQSVLSQIKKKWGKAVFDQGQLSRIKLAERVFNHPEDLKFLESVLHPIVRKKFDEWKRRQESSIVFKEVAILFEKGGDQQVDYTVTVSVNEEERIARVMRRDQVSEEQVKARLKNQWKEEDRNEKADFIIYNEAEFLIIPQVLAIIHQIQS